MVTAWVDVRTTLQKIQKGIAQLYKTSRTWLEREMERKRNIRAFLRQDRPSSTTLVKTLHSGVSSPCLAVHFIGPRLLRFGDVYQLPTPA